MRLVRRISLGVAVLVVIALVVGLTYVVHVVRQPFAQVSGSASLPGLSGKVSVMRDDQGVPQVYADTADDLFRAQGFVQAQDRFFEMDFRRHVTAGRLSELVGVDADALEADKVVRTLGWRRVAEQELPLLSPETQRYLQDYADGVNAYLKGRSKGQVSLEYVVLGHVVSNYRIEPWTPVDSLSWLKAMAWDLKANYGDEAARAELAQSIPEPRIDELYPTYPYRKNLPILSDADLSGATGNSSNTGARTAPRYIAGERDALRAAGLALDAVPRLLGQGDGIGSNSWVVDGAHTTTGRPLLANDPHLAPSIPGIWYQMGLHCRQLGPACPFDVAGFTFAGLPGVVIGHNNKVAWGFTNLPADVTDLYLERVLGDTYERDGQYVPMTTSQETIKVAGAKDVTITVRSTVHGPIISDVLDEALRAGRGALVDGRRDPNDYDVALEWTALTPGRTADALFALDAAQDWDEFRSAAKLFDVPAQNMIYADTSGNIGYQAPGQIPVRASSTPGANPGEWPAQGWNSKYDWKGYVPFSQMPSTYDPPEGFIVAANQAVDDRVEPYLTGDWDYGYRAQRIRHLLERGPKISPATMRSVQMDERDPFASTLVPYLVRISLRKDRFTRQAQDLLRDWDFSSGAKSAPAAYYNAVWANLLRLTFDDELSGDRQADGGDRWYSVVDILLKDPSNAWWDDKGTPGVIEGRDEILREALVDARAELTKSLGKDPTKWQWGQLHQLTLRNPVLGGGTTPGIVQSVFNRGPWSLAGGNGLVDATGWTAYDGYKVDWVPSMRMVVDLSDLDHSTWVNLTGASGHAYSKHYVDQSDAWAEGRTYTWPFSAGAIRRATANVLTLHP
ncbi:MAG: penicillin acylase family protein [Actinomycetales bacterium]